MSLLLGNLRDLLGDLWDGRVDPDPDPGPDPVERGDEDLDAER